VWNATASVPRGLYAVEADGPLARGDYVVAQLPGSFRRLADQRGYLPAHIPLVKPVSAVAGDSVCALGQEILINGRQVGDRLAKDLKGRPMPGWSGCVRLKDGEVFLFRTGMPQSFDGRYFGITPRSAILGRADPLWLR
jgi:conjugative transfer signal peptidase TraF